mgnify:CR=1 FL=1
MMHSLPGSYLPANCGVAGVVLADHARSLDWRSRRAEFIAEAPAAVVNEVRGKLGGLLGMVTS